MFFGQLVVGPPGSGKSTYISGLTQFFASPSSPFFRPLCKINLDPGNDPSRLSYDADISITELITIEDVMEFEGLGPNGGLIYCMEHLEKNFEWLVKRMEEEVENHRRVRKSANITAQTRTEADKTTDDRVEKKGEQEAEEEDEDDVYFVFDLPGQVELFTDNTALATIVHRLEREMNVRLAAVHMVDAHYITNAATFLSALLVSLKAMLCLALPHVNVLSKLDLVSRFHAIQESGNTESSGQAFDLEYYTRVMDLEYLAEQLDRDDRLKQFTKLNRAICDVVEDFGLVSFVPLAIEDKELMWQVVKRVDTANGYGQSVRGEAMLEHLADSGVDISTDSLDYDMLRAKYFPQ